MSKSHVAFIFHDVLASIWTIRFFFVFRENRIIETSLYLEGLQSRIRGYVSEPLDPHKEYVCVWGGWGKLPELSCSRL